MCLTQTATENTFFLCQFIVIVILDPKVNSSFLFIDSNGPGGLGDRDSETWPECFLYCLPVSRQQQTATVITSSGRMGLPCINLKATLS